MRACYGERLTADQWAGEQKKGKKEEKQRTNQIKYRETVAYMYCGTYCIGDKFPPRNVYTSTVGTRDIINYNMYTRGVVYIYCSTYNLI